MDKPTRRESGDAPLPVARKGPLDARVAVPGSKSVTNRALLVAALARGESRIGNALESDDTRAMRRALAALGVAVGDAPDGSIRVAGSGGPFPAKTAALDVENAGTAMRFLASALALGGDDADYVLDGNARMRERPIGDLVHALRATGARVDYAGRDGFPPLRIRGGAFRVPSVRLKGDVSSQFVSSILLAAPASGRAIEVAVENGELASPSYVDLTLSVMAAFGAPAESAGKAAWRVPAGRGYVGRDYRVEGDWSAASYFLAAPAIAGGRIAVTGLDARSVQGDARFADLLREMGLRVERGDDAVTVERTGSVTAIDADLHDMPDVAMTLAAVAAFARGTTRVRGVPNLRVKESDRIAATCAELRRLGIRATERDDGFEIEGGAPHGAEIETYDDHRIAMSFALVGLATDGVAIRDPRCVGKTFPDFFERLGGLAEAKTPRGAA